MRVVTSFLVTMLMLVGVSAPPTSASDSPATPPAGAAAQSSGLPERRPVNYRDYGFLYNSIRNDGVFNSLAGNGIARFEAANSVAVRQRAAPTPADTIKAVRDLADRGVGTFVMLGWSHAEALKTLVTEYPDVHFTVIDGQFDAPNVRSILFREEEAGYLVGVAAGLATKTGRVAFIGAVPIPPVVRFGCGFLQGVRLHRPDADIRMDYLVREGDGFREGVKARMLAERLVAEGVDVVFPAAGIAGHRALAVAAKAGVLGIGVDSNQNGDFPGHILTSAVKRVDEAVVRTLHESHQGTWTPGTVIYGLADGAVDWARDHHNEPLVAGFADRIEAARESVAVGRVVVGGPDDVPACKP